MDAPERTPGREREDPKRSPVHDRAKEMLPSVLLTLVSVIQALVLEALREGASTSQEIFAGGLVSVLTALQIVAVFLTIVLVWVYYAQLVMRFRWVPSLQDTAALFGLGLGQSALTMLLRPERLALWCVVLAIIFGIAFASSWVTFLAAEREPENAWFFELLERRPIRRLAPPLLTLAGFLGSAGVAALSGGEGLAALVAVLAVNGILLAQLDLQRRYWRRTVLAIDDDG